MATFLRPALALSAVFFAFSAHGDELNEVSPYEVCDRIITQSKRTECVEAIRGTFPNQGLPVSGKAAGICLNMIAEDGKLNCIKAISGKLYNLEGIKFCAKMFGDRDRIACLAVAGWPPNSTDPFCRVSFADLVRNLDLIESILSDANKPEKARIASASTEVKELTIRVKACGRAVTAPPAQR